MALSPIGSDAVTGGTGKAAFQESSPVYSRAVTHHDKFQIPSPHDLDEILSIFISTTVTVVIVVVIVGTMS